MKITIYYKNGNKLTENIGCFKQTGNKIEYIVERRVHGLFEGYVSVNMDYVDQFTIEEE